MRQRTIIRSGVAVFAAILAACQTEAPTDSTVPYKGNRAFDCVEGCQGPPVVMAMANISDTTDNAYDVGSTVSSYRCSNRCMVPTGDIERTPGVTSLNAHPTRTDLL